MENQTAPPRVEKNDDPDYPIWLLGDSPSVNYPDLTPLDPTHPSRHTIWTPILDVIQRHLFLERGQRLDDSKLFIRNAVSDYRHKLEKPKTLGAEIAKFQDKQVEEIKELRELLNRPNKPRPLLVLCFGEFAYACALRTQQEVKEILRPQDWNKWGIRGLSREFKVRIDDVQLGRVTLLPLLHASVALSFQDASRNFSGGGGNYFEYDGREIADKLILHSQHPRLTELWLPAKREGTASE
jgi:hypothetical protein